MISQIQLAFIITNTFKEHSTKIQYSTSFLAAQLE